MHEAWGKVVIYMQFKFKKGRREKIWEGSIFEKNIIAEFS